MPDGEVAPVSMSLAEDGTRASVIDSDHDVRLFDLDDRSQLGEYSPFGRKVVTSAVDPVSGAVAFGETRDLCATCAATCGEPERSTSRYGRPLGCHDLRGARWGAVDVEYSADGSLFAALAVTPRCESSVAVALWQGARDATGPILLDPDVSASRSRPPSPGRTAGRRGEVLAGRLPAVRQRNRTDRRLRDGLGEELDRIAGNGILAVSPDGRRIAVRDGSLAVRIVDPSASKHPARSRCHPFRRWPTSALTAAGSPSPPAQTSWWRTPRPAISLRRSASMTAPSPPSNSGPPAIWSPPERTARSSRGISATGVRAPAAAAPGRARTTPGTAPGRAPARGTPGG